MSRHSGVTATPFDGDSDDACWCHGPTEPGSCDGRRQEARRPIDPVLASAIVELFADSAQGVSQCAESTSPSKALLSHVEDRKLMPFSEAGALETRIVDLAIENPFDIPAQCQPRRPANETPR